MTVLLSGATSTTLKVCAVDAVGMVVAGSLPVVVGSVVPVDVAGANGSVVVVVPVVVTAGAVSAAATASVSAISALNGSLPNALFDRIGWVTVSITGPGEGTGATLRDGGATTCSASPPAKSRKYATTPRTSTAAAPPTASSLVRLAPSPAGSGPGPGRSKAAVCPWKGIVDSLMSVTPMSLRSVTGRARWRPLAWAWPAV